MSKRKARPERGTRVTEAMSQRDMCAALGTTTAFLNRCKRLADIPEAEFEERLARQSECWAAGGPKVTTESLLRGAPVPARGRVQRALAMVRGMTPAELREYLVELRRLAVEREAESDNA
jgi:hypothetical protein